MIAGGIAAIVLTGALIPAGFVEVAFLPPVDSDIVTARLEMPEGTPARITGEAARNVEAAGLRALRRFEVEQGAAAGPLVSGVLRTIGMQPRQYGGVAAPEASLQPPANRASVEFKLADGGGRRVPAMPSLRPGAKRRRV